MPPLHELYPPPTWAVQQTNRQSGLVEDICEHGVGHPNRHWIAEHDPDGKRALGVHGCDGCCHTAPKQAIPCTLTEREKLRAQIVKLEAKVEDLEGGIQDLKYELKEQEARRDLSCNDMDGPMIPPIHI